jgi:hypothetical protein
VAGAGAGAEAEAEAEAVPACLRGTQSNGKRTRPRVVLFEGRDSTDSA